MTSDTIGVVLLAEGPGELVRASIVAFGAALERLEHESGATEAVVVDRTEDADGAAVLAALEGATVLRGAPREREAAALLRAVDALPPEVERVVVSATDAAPHEEALSAMLADSDRNDADLTLADASDPAPYAVLRRRARAALAHLAADADDRPVVAALARELADAGREVSTATGAGQVRGVDRAPLAHGAMPGVAVRALTADAVMIGAGSYLGAGGSVVTFEAHERIEIGAYCSIADEVRLMHGGSPLHDTRTGEPVTFRTRGAHRMWAASTFPIEILTRDPRGYEEIPRDGSVEGRPLLIGNDVWIGAQVLVVGPVTIGDGAVIGAGAVVRRDVRPYEVVIGNPAQAVRRRFDDRTCDRLLKLRWWEWQQPIVRGNHLRFTEPVERFLDRFDPAGVLHEDEVAATAGSVTFG